MPRRLSKLEFIEKSKALHGNKYGYDKVIYKQNKIKVCIICSTHGEFYQTPNDHLKGWGCDKCRQEKTGLSLRLTNEEFVEKAKLVHGDRFDYSLSNYINHTTKVCIVCYEHGKFWQKPNDHLNGQGCPICKASKGELLIKVILDKYNINYIQEYKIPNQIYKFRYDFYLPEHNLLIEFHGRQHYEFIPYFHKTEDNFLQYKQRDIFKIELAKMLNYSFIEFNHNQLKNVSKEVFEMFLLSKLGKG